MSNTDLLGQLLLSLEQHDADLFKRLYPALSKQTVQSHPIQAIELAYALLGKKRFEEAAGIAYALLEKNGKSGPLLSFLACVHLRAGDFRAASELYSKAAVIGLDAIGQAEYAFSEAKLRRTECAISLYKKALKQGHPDPDFVKAKLHHQLQLGCMWGELEEIEPELRASLRIGASAVDPFAFQASTSRPEELLLAARNFATRNGIKRVIGDVQKREKRWSSSRALRLGFFSGEFRSQATGFLVVGLIEQLHQLGISVLLIDNGYDDKSEVSKRLRRAATVLDISRLGDEEARLAVRRQNLDFVFDLNGYFGRGRNKLFTKPIADHHVNFLGFPGTLGSDAYDCIVGDFVVTPKGDEASFAERILRMPCCYQPNDILSSDDLKAITERTVRDDTVRYACLNNTYKITRSVFDAWLEILLKVNDSRLILLEDNSLAKSQLVSYAASRGIAEYRLEFWGRVPRADHLRRHDNIDLFLDTSPMGAHTTASDALRRGVPVLTKMGTTFPSRVAASQLTTLGLGDLVVESAMGYVEEAVHFGESLTYRRTIQSRYSAAILSDRILFQPEVYAASFLQTLRSA
jgi:predicted O-linked N-acetylglucosamine transferase (SPINDLY family)